MHTARLIWDLFIVFFMAAGAFYLEYRLWCWVWRFIKKEWRELMGQPEPVPEPRYGYLRVTSASIFRKTKVEVVPWDGGDPIIIPVFSIQVTGKVNDYTRAHITAGLSEIDLHGGYRDERETVKGKSLRPERKLVTQSVEARDAEGEPIRATKFIWTHLPDEACPRLYLQRVKRES